MAITNTCVRFLVWAKQQGVSFQRTLTLGHLENLCDKETLNAIAHTSSAFEAEQIDWKDRYADSIFHSLGAMYVHSMDHSNYEQASVVHDLNQPLPASQQQQYSVVVDGGTLEHVFNFPQAISNCMEALSIGGHFIGFSPVNNLMGHGLYQFSPELYYRVFSAENGFAIKGMFLVAAGFDVDATTWYAVSDPAIVKSRVTLTNTLPTYLMILARKTENKKPFAQPIYQSDYTTAWADKKVAAAQQSPKPGLLKRILRKLTGRPRSTEDLEKIDPRFYKKRNP